MITQIGALHPTEWTGGAFRNIQITVALYKGKWTRSNDGK